MARPKTFLGPGTSMTLWVSVELLRMFEEAAAVRGNTRSEVAREVLEAWAAGRSERYVVELEDGSIL
jgi:RNA 3'-terminal phosphate cyclase